MDAVAKLSKGVSPKDFPSRRYSLSRNVFICHSSRNKDAAYEICELLEARGISSWIAPRDVRKGRNYDEEILIGIKETQVMAVLLSEGSDQSRHVKREVEIADQEKKIFFPIRVQDFQLGENLRYYLASKQWIDVWEKPLKEYGDQIAESIRDLLNPLAGDDETEKRPGQSGKSLWQAQKSWRGKTRWFLISAIILAVALLIVILFVPWGGGNILYLPAHH